jgi:hypothetical protein
MAAYYQRFTRDFSGIAVPLTEMLQKRCPNSFTLDDCQEEAFKQLKEALVRAPVLWATNFNKDFVLQTDALNIGLGAVQTQYDDDGKHPIACKSRKIIAAEQNYSTVE